MIKIRPASLDDAKIMGEIHYYTWLTTYARILDENYLKTRSLKKSSEIFEKNQCKNHLVASLNEQVCGFIAYGPARDNNLTIDSEIYAFYVLKAFQKKGVGKALLHEVLKILKQLGYSTVSLCVLSENQQAITFYEQNGFVKDGNKRTINLGKLLTEIRLVKKI